MPTVHVIQTDFTAGQISPRLYNRVDLDSYGHGCRIMKNAFALPHGGATRRPGTYWINEVFDSDEPVRLIPFTFSRASAFVLVINAERMEIIKDGQFIETAPGSDIFYGIPVPYTSSEIDELRYAQIGATMFFAHPNHPPKVLTRISDTNWQFVDVEFSYRAISDFWYETGYVRFKIINGTTDFAPGDVIIINTNFSVDYSGVTSGGDGLVFGIEFFETPETWTLTCQFADADRQEWLVEGSASGSSAAKFKPDNYPAAVSLYEQRLYWAGTPNEPQTLFGSATGAYQDLTLGARASDGVQFTIASNTYDQILHLESTRQLVPLSYGGEFSVIGGESVGITPATVRIFSQTSHGTSIVTPIRIGQEILFCQRGSKKIRAISYSVTEDVNLAPDITILAEDITGSGLLDSTFAQDPDYMAWFTTKDGGMVSLTHLRDFGVTAWAQHDTTNGVFENVATIPEGETDVTYCCVQRIVNGIPRRYIEFLEYADEVNSDSSLIGTFPSPQAVVGGLDHLEGETVDVVADGNVHPQVVVENGQIDLDYEATSVIVGVPFITTIETLHPHLQLADGSSWGRNLSINEVSVTIQDTVGCYINGEEIFFRQFGDLLDTPVPAKSAVLRVHTQTGWGTTEGVVIEQRIPKPFTILGLVAKVTVND